MEASEKYLARFPDIADSQRRTYAAMMSAMDDAIGRTLAAVHDQKLEEKTLVIFLNDNGGPTMPTTTVNGSTRNRRNLAGSLFFWLDREIRFRQTPIVA